MPEQVRVSVVICAYADRRWERLCAAIQSLRRLEELPFEIIAVIDHNPALERRCREAFQDIPVIGNTGHRGLAGARNSGVRAAAGDVIAFIDDDAVASSDWLSRMAAHYAEPSVV